MTTRSQLISHIHAIEGPWLATPAAIFMAPRLEPSSAPPLSLTLMLALTCCALSLVVGVLVLGFVLNVAQKKEKTGEKEPPESRE